MGGSIKMTFFRWFPLLTAAFIFVGCVTFRKEDTSRLRLDGIVCEGVISIKGNFRSFPMAENDKDVNFEFNNDLLVKSLAGPKAMNLEENIAARFLYFLEQDTGCKINFVSSNEMKRKNVGFEIELLDNSTKNELNGWNMVSFFTLGLFPSWGNNRLEAHVRVLKFGVPVNEFVFYDDTLTLIHLSMLPIMPFVQSSREKFLESVMAVSNSVSRVIIENSMQ